MRHCLPSVHSILDSETQGGRFEDAFDHAADALDGEEKITDICAIQISKSGDATQRANEDVPRDDRLEVHKSKAVRSDMEDLCQILASTLHNRRKLLPAAPLGRDRSIEP
jgi:hypothetical protein